MSITFKQLEAFHAIVVAGSMARATGVLGLSQPTLSQQLARLEETLGTVLLNRQRSGQWLTPAGEHWFRTASRLLDEMDRARNWHRTQFDRAQLSLSFGSTPSLRGRLVELVADTVVAQGAFAQCDFSWAATSESLVEQIDSHRINCAIVNAASLAQATTTLEVQHLFDDAMAWAVPAELPDATITRVLAGQPAPSGAQPQALIRQVAVTSAMSWKDRSAEWYRRNLPLSAPFFSCETHSTAAEIVAAGHATCHIPVSLLANLPEQLARRLKVFDLDEIAREIVLVMPRHLMSLAPFSALFEQLGATIRASHGGAVARAGLGPVPRPHPDGRDRPADVRNGEEHNASAPRLAPSTGNR